MREMTVFIEFGLHVLPTLCVVSSVKLYVEKKHAIKYKRVVFSLCFAWRSIPCKHLCFIDLQVWSFVVSILNNLFLPD